MGVFYICTEWANKPAWGSWYGAIINDTPTTSIQYILFIKNYTSKYINIPELDSPRKYKLLEYAWLQKCQL